MKLAAWLAVCALPLPAVDRCIQVDSSRILVSHIVPAVPELSALPGGLVLGYAPSPGLVRWWKGRHVRALALRRGVDIGAISDFCVERPASPIGEDEVASVLASLLPPGARLQLVDYCRLRMPRGELQFTLRGLVRPPNPLPGSLLMWRGRLIYDKNRSAPFWATVRVSVRREGVYAVRQIPQGKLVAAEDVRLESREESLFSAVPAAEFVRLLGRRARRNISPGSAVPEDLLVAPREVNPGEVIEVQVQSGTTRLKLNAQAVTGGSAGDPVLLRNRTSGKQFKAIIDGKSRAVLDLEDSDAEDRTPGAAAFPAAQSGSADHSGGSRSQGKIGARSSETARSIDPGS